jgi:hypothetical protein
LKSWGEGYRSAIIKSIDQEIARFREDVYKPEKDLRKHGFKKLRVKIWKRSEFYTVPNALEYVQSVSIWNSVPRALRAMAIDGVKKHFQRLFKKHGKIERRLVVRVVAGYKR